MNPPNILLIMLDATRADVCSCYGYERSTTPVLDRLAGEGVIYDCAISPAPWTLPSVASLFTGLYPSQTGIYDSLKLDDGFPTIAQTLSESGYATFGITSNSWLSADFGLQRGFDTIHKQWQWLQTDHEINRLVIMQDSQPDTWLQAVVGRLLQGSVFANAINAAFIRYYAYRFDSGAFRVLRPFSRWVQQQEGPWFAFVHYLEAHLPYHPPRRLAARFATDLGRCKTWLRKDQWRSAWRHIAGVERLSEDDLVAWRDLYAAEVAYADYHMGQMVDWLEQADQLDNTLIIVVADHGENLGQHGLLNHQYCLYNTLLRVPMIIRYPAVFEGGTRVKYPVQTLDLYHTIVDAAGIAGSESAQYSLLGKGQARPHVFADYGEPRTPHAKTLERYGLTKEALNRFQRGLAAIISGTDKLILGTDGSVELYDLEGDSEEEHNLCRVMPERVVELSQILTHWQETQRLSEQSTDSQTYVESDVEARLRALGYI